MSKMWVLRSGTLRQRVDWHGVDERIGVHPEVSNLTTEAIQATALRCLHQEYILKWMLC
jgi:hypothetical protein